MNEEVILNAIDKLTVAKRYAEAAKLKAYIQQDSEAFRKMENDTLILAYKKHYLDDTAFAQTFEAIEKLKRSPLYKHRVKLATKRAEQTMKELEKRNASCFSEEDINNLAMSYDKMDGFCEKPLKQLYFSLKGHLDKNKVPHSDIYAQVEVARIFCETACKSLEIDTEMARKEGITLYLRLQNKHIKSLLNATSTLARTLFDGREDKKIDLNDAPYAQQAYNNLAKAVCSYENIIDAIEFEK